MANCRKCAAPNSGAQHAKSCPHYVASKCEDCQAELRSFGALHDHQSKECPARLNRLVREGKLQRG